MSGAPAWIIVALALGVVVVRRRSVAVALVTAEAILVAAVALRDAAGGAEIIAATGAAAPRARPRGALRRVDPLHA